MIADSATKTRPTGKRLGKVARALVLAGLLAVGAIGTTGLVAADNGLSNGNDSTLSVSAGPMHLALPDSSWST